MKNNILRILKDIRPEMDFTESNDFIEDGYIDSFEMIALVSALDKAYNISIMGEDILPENFCNLDSIENIIKKYVK